MNSRGLMFGDMYHRMMLELSTLVQARAEKQQEVSHLLTVMRNLESAHYKELAIEATSE